MKAKILFVEDDINLGFVTKDNLEEEGYEIIHCEDGAIGFEEFRKTEFDLCLLDVMLPQMDGFTLAQKIREINSEIPIIFLTAKSMQEDKIVGLKLGADDYITKPFSIEELILKIEVFLKRQKITESAKPQTTFTIGNYTFDSLDYSLKLEDKERKLTRRENELLTYFAENIGIVLKREDILMKIWGNDDYFNGRSLDVFISRLRKYLKDDSRIEIKNIHRVGFKMSLKN